MIQPSRATVPSRLARLVSLAALAGVMLMAASCGNGVTQASRRGSTTTTTADAPTTTTEDIDRSSTTTTPSSSSSTTAPPEEETTTTAGGGGGSPEAFPKDWLPPILNWSPCGGLECATLNVPLDWSNLDGPTIGLALAKNPAAGDRKGSVLTNPGGPGGSGVEFVQQGVFSEQAFEELRASYDILGWDPRGVGGSQSVECGDDTSDYLHLDSDPDSEDEQAALDAAAAKVAEACAELGEDFLSHISTEDTVMDMEAIRRTIGDEGLTYYGFSYGTTLGSVYADTFPRNVRAIVLDGVADPSADLEEFLAAQTAAFERQLNSIFATCGGLDECPTDDPAALYDQVARQLEQEPLSTSEIPIGPAELAVAAIAITYVEGAEADFIPALVEATEGSGEGLAWLADIYYGATEFDPYLAIECVDQPHPVGDADWQEFADRMVAISPRLGASVANELLPCANWSVEASAQRPMPTATGAPPILVVGNSGDAATPIEQAIAMADSLSSGVLVTSEGLGHTSYGNSCVDAITAAYLLDLKVPPAGTTC